MKYWLSLTTAALAAVVIGFASTILVLMHAAQAIGATLAQQASMAAVLCFAMATTSFFLCLRYKMPIIIAWSTPGAALIVGSAQGVTYPAALGAFVFAGALMVLTGLVRPLERAIARMPAAIAAAMLAGVLFSYVLKVTAAAIASPWLVVPLVVTFFSIRMIYPMYAVPIIVLLGLALAVLTGDMGTECCAVGLTRLTFEVPQFEWPVMVGLGLPLFLVTMASQNLPGFAVLRAAGYQAPVRSILVATGVGSMISAPFGGHAVNAAAITASLATGSDAHPDPSQRWKIAYPYFVLYVALGLAAMSFVTILGALPKELVAAIAGLALFGPLMNGMVAMMQNSADVEAALVTFLVTASGVTMFGVGAAFWGLVTGMTLWGLKKYLVSKP
jgi:benzoate membrane transport protein